MPYVRSGQARLHVERAGSGEPLLLLTGFAISSEIFRHVLPLYTPHLECVTFDNRGAGRSSLPLLPTSMPELAADAVRVLDALEIDAAHVYGISMGGMIAQELALRFPDRVRGLVLGATSPGGPRAARPGLGELGALAAQRTPGVPNAVRRQAIVRALFAEEFAREHPERVTEALRHLGTDRARPLGAWWHLWASVYHDTVERLPRIAAPTLVLHGAEDSLTPTGNARMLARRIPDATLEMLPGAGHLYVVEQAELARDVLVDWLRERSPIPPGPPLSPAAKRAEQLTRTAGLQTGALRTGRSLLRASVRASVRATRRRR